MGADFAWQYNAMGDLMAVQAGERWQARLQHDARGLEVQRQLSSGVQQGWQYDALGRPTRQQVQARGSSRQRTYHWRGTDQLAAIDDSLAGTTRYTYDALGALTEARYPDGQEELRLADAVGNLFRSPTLSDRIYGPGGQLHAANGTRYHYDTEGNLLRKSAADGQQWQYSWDGAGQLVGVRLPSGNQVTFTYDALGRRVAKRYRGLISGWVWEGDVPLHEWQEREAGSTLQAIEELSTWLFEENSFAPAAKLTAQGAYSVVGDHLGTPLALYDEQGQLKWEMQLDGYGQVRRGQGQAQQCPFRYQGQYEDVETGLYYNRARYYDPAVGVYISQDPLKWQGSGRLYGYVLNTAAWVDVFGLIPVYRNLRSDENPANGLSARKPGRGMEANGHIRNGSKETFKGSQYISTTTDPAVTDEWRQPGQRTVMFDTDDVVPDVRGNRSIKDLSTLEKAKAEGLRGPSPGYAAKSREVLVEGHVPADKITDVTPCS